MSTIGGLTVGRSPQIGSGGAAEFSGVGESMFTDVHASTQIAPSATAVGEQSDEPAVTAAAPWADSDRPAAIPATSNPLTETHLRTTRVNTIHLPRVMISGRHSPATLGTSPHNTPCLQLQIQVLCCAALR